MEEFLASSAFQDIAERNLQVAIQICLDVGAHIISALGLKRPEEYGDVFRILGEERIIPPEFAQKIIPLAGLRNILVHEYLEIKLDRIHECLKKINDFERFAQYIIQFIERRE